MCNSNTCKNVKWMLAMIDLEDNLIVQPTVQTVGLQWNSAFFAFSFIIEGNTEKLLQLMIPLKSIYNRNIGFIKQKMYLWTLQRVSCKKNSSNWHHFCHEKIIYVDLFRGAPYMLMLELHKDALLHSFWIIQ